MKHYHSYEVEDTIVMMLLFASDKKMLMKGIERHLKITSEYEVGWENVYHHIVYKMFIYLFYKWF